MLAQKDLERQALELSREQRAELARVLLLSLDSEGEDISPEEWAEAWSQEAERRYQEVLQGKVTLIPSGEVLREARSRLK